MKNATQGRRFLINLNILLTRQRRFPFLNGPLIKLNRTVNSEIKQFIS